VKFADLGEALPADPAMVTLVEREESGSPISGD
jgi:hypothetical protein